MTNNIVTVNVSQTVAPTPNLLQKKGAFISQGATNTVAGTATLLTQLSDLTPILTGAKAITTVTWASSVATATTTTPHGFTNGDTLLLTIAGFTPVGYNGTFLCTITGASSFTYPLVASPGSMTVAGVYTPEDVAELLAMVTTFFAQGSSQAVWVQELGAGNAADGVTALTALITANPNIYYSYLVPRGWSSEATFLSLIASFENTTAKTYFFVTMTTNNYTSFTALMKDVVGLIEAPAIPALEFSLAALFFVTLNYAPSTTNQVTPLSFAFVFGVTPYPLKSNGALFATLKLAGVNWIGTGAEGGISNTVVFWGTTMDGRPFNYWYSVDWVQINLDLDLSNEMINGSNNPQAPLYYNQPGINRLQGRAQQTMTRGIAFGLVLAPVTVTAVPFLLYTQQNPSDYKLGNYNGLGVVYTPARGFEQLTFNVQVTDFVAA